MSSVVDHLFALIQTSSVSAQSNRPVVEYAKTLLHQHSWQTREFTYRDKADIEKVNLLAAPANQNIEQVDIELALLCHTDTVPYSTTWKSALQPRELSGFVYGCGACDVKGFLACLLTAVEITHGLTLSEIRIVLTADEEVGCVGAAHFLASGVLRPKRVVVGEPTSSHPARAGKGYALAEFTIHGQEAHSALPDMGVSAIYGASKLVSAIEDYAAELAMQQNPFFSPPFTTLNIGVIQGGTAKNIIAGSCSFLLEWRPIPHQNPSSVFEAVKNLADQIAAADPKFKYSATLLREQLGFETQPGSMLVRAVEKVTAHRPVSIPFGSEASLFAAIAEEVIVFGPGDMQTAHSERECVPVAELDGAVACLKQLMTSSG